MTQSPFFRRFSAFTALLLVFPFSPTAAAKPPGDAPKLVVTVVVDQMRHEYLDRFYDKFGEGGFKRLLNEGADFRNAHYNYMPTATGPGHAAVATGALPNVSGIIGNGWYDRLAAGSVNVVSGDTAYHSVGVNGEERVGRASPHFLLVTTFGDELKKASNFRAKVAGIGIKDRAAILSSGHTADGAYWYDGQTGRFITSSYYRETLPDWLQRFNDSGLKDSLNDAIWSLSLPAEEYTESRADHNDYERLLVGKDSPSFPYDLPQMRGDNAGYHLIPTTPFGNEYVERLAEEMIIQEGFGEDDITDLLAVNFSSTDIVGHSFGPYSVEIEDMYIKLDRTLARLLDFLDRKVGDGEYVVALTADHGAVGNPLYLRSKKLPAGVFNPAAITSRAAEFLSEELGLEDVILNGGSMQLYLDDARLRKEGKYEETVSRLKDFLLTDETVYSAYTARELMNLTFPERSLGEMLQNGYHPQRSGDVLFITKPGHLGIAGSIVTGHGTPYSYDTHIPILFYGKNVTPGSHLRRVHITDIAPTLSFLSRVMLPNGAFSDPLIEVFAE